MSTTNSKLELFALKSFVSVLPENNKETALQIVGGGDPPCEDYEGEILDMYDCGAWDCIDDIFDFGEGEEGLEGLYFEYDDDGNIIDWNWGDPPGDGNYLDHDGWDEWKDENPCPLAYL